MWGQKKKVIIFSVMGVSVFAILAIVLATTLAKSVEEPTKDALSINIVHMNDFHSRFEETNAVGSACKTGDCIGGFSRNYKLVMDILKDIPDSLLLNAGDNYQGTFWYTFLKWNVTSYFMNTLPFTAHTLGNHEFDDSIEGVVPFIKALKAPVVVCNIDDSEEPDIQGLYNKSMVIERGGKKIGIIGVITKTTDNISNPRKLKFLDESESVNKEAERLVKEEGVFTNIVLSHSGYDVDKEMAAKATKEGKISVIVGGHSHTFLYTGDDIPGPEKPQGPYPTIVNRKDGKKILITQASSFARYLGNFSVNFDENGDVSSWIGKPLYLDTKRPHDEGMDKKMKPWKDAVDDKGNEVLGSSLVKLNRENCKYDECLVGNFVADAMISAFREKAKDNEWTYAAIAVTNAGGLRAEIQKGNITLNDMVTAQPFMNTIDVSDIQGQYLKDTFEFVARQAYYYGRDYVSVSLLQISGIHVTLDMAQPTGHRVKSLKVRCQACDVPKYEEVAMNQTYRILTPSFLTRGGDAFAVLADNLKNTKIGEVDMNIYRRYLKEKSPIFEEVQGRYIIEGKHLIKRKLQEN